MYINNNEVINYYVSSIKLKHDTWYMYTYLSRFQEAAIFRKTNGLGSGEYLCYENEVSAATRSKPFKLTCAGKVSQTPCTKLKKMQPCEQKLCRDAVKSTHVIFK